MLCFYGSICCKQLSTAHSIVLIVARGFFVFSRFPFLPSNFSCELNEGTATVGCSATNWYRGGRWWWGGDRLSCHLPQGHKLISVPQSKHTCCTCVIPAFLTETTLTDQPIPSKHTHTHKRTATDSMPHISLLSPLVSMMGAVEELSSCQRVSALRGEGTLRDLWQWDRAQTDVRLLGVWEL